MAHPSRSGAAVSSRTSADPAVVWRSASSTDSQNRCGSRSSPPAGTYATLSARPAAAIHDRNRTVLPLPGGAETTVTRCEAPGRWTASGGKQSLPHQGARPSWPGHTIPQQAPRLDHRTTPSGDERFFPFKCDLIFPVPGVAERAIGR